MRIIIIPDDTLVAVDGDFVNGVDMSSMPEEIHAVQWYDDKGEIEFKDGRPNEVFTDFEERFGQFIQLHADRNIDIKSNTPPNTYSDWDEETKEWMVNNDKKLAYDILQQVKLYKTYLNDTDWYYARLQETGVAVPEEVVSKRIEARTYIQENEV